MDRRTFLRMLVGLPTLIPMAAQASLGGVAGIQRWWGGRCWMVKVRAQARALVKAWMRSTFDRELFKGFVAGSGRWQ